MKVLYNNFLFVVIFIPPLVKGSWEMHRRDFKHPPNLEKILKGSDSPHPLDPLTAAEIANAVQIVLTNKSPGEDFSFLTILPQEPSKAELLPFFLSGTDPPLGLFRRKAYLLLYENKGKRVVEVVVDLNENKVENKKLAPPTSIPPLAPADLFDAEFDTVLKHPEVMRRCADLGYPNMSLVAPHPWSMGYVGDKPEFKNETRLVQYVMYAKNFEDDSQFAHPLDFFVIADLNERKVVLVEDLPTHSDFSTGNNQGLKAPKGEGNYDYKYNGGEAFLRQGDKPITVQSPDGKSFNVQGYKVDWQKWSFRIGFNGKEGLVLHMVTYKDEGTLRPIMFRGSLAEMFIPYGDPRPPFHRKQVFDLGEYGIGYTADKQVKGEDVLGESYFFDMALHNVTGGPVPYIGAIAVREEDAGILWKHVDYRTGKGVTARSHRLVVSLISTIGNYDYLFSWIFYQDGTLQFQAMLTGIVSTNMMAPDANPGGFGETMSPQVDAQYHQHFFCTRLDLDVDGVENSVVTSDVVPLSQPTGSPENPFGQGFTVNETLLRTTGEARTNFQPLKARTWVTKNPNKNNPSTGKPVGFKLMPANSPPLLAKMDSPVRERAGFIKYDTWVTRQKDEQRFPTNNPDPQDNLPNWVGSGGDSLENTDIVLWHNFGVVHIPRPEDYPVMPVEVAGFYLKPYNFFKENPSIDVPQAIS